MLKECFAVLPEHVFFVDLREGRATRLRIFDQLLCEDIPLQNMNFASILIVDLKLAEPSFQQFVGGVTFGGGRELGLVVLLALGG